MYYDPEDRVNIPIKRLKECDQHVFFTSTIKDEWALNNKNILIHERERKITIKKKHFSCVHLL